MYFTDKQLLVSEWWKKNAAVVRANSISYIACWQFMIVKYVDFSFPYFNIPPSYMASIYSHSFQMISALDVEFLVWVFCCSSVVVIFVHSFFFCVNFAVVLYLVHFPPQMTLLHSEWETFYCLFYLKLCTLFRFNRIETVLPRERKKVCFSYWHSEEPIFQCAICTSKRCTTNGNRQRWHFTEKSAISFKVIENRHTHTHSHAYSNL